MIVSHHHHDCCIFSIFDSFHFLNSLIIVILQKTPRNPRVAV